MTEALLILFEALRPILMFAVGTLGISLLWRLLRGPEKPPPPNVHFHEYPYEAYTPPPEVTRKPRKFRQRRSL